MGLGPANNGYEPTRLLPGCGLCLLLGPTRKPRTRRRSTFFGLHQHHRLLCPNGLSLRTRTRLQPSLRDQKLVPTRHLLPANGPDPPPCCLTHQPPLAKPRENHGGHGPGRGHNVNGGHLLPLLPPGPFDKQFAPATEGVPPVTAGGEAHDVLHHGCGCAPRAAERGDGADNGARGRRGGGRFGDDEFEHGSADGGVVHEVGGK